MEEIEGFIRQGLKRYFPELREAVELPLGNPEGSQLFFQKSERIFWCRLFFEPVGQREILGLQKEYQALGGLFRQQIWPYIFFPSRAEELDASELGLFSCRFFEYRCVKAPARGEVLLTECVNPKGNRFFAPPPSVGAVLSKSSRLFERARLSRQELSELIEISLELRKAVS